MKGNLTIYQKGLGGKMVNNNVNEKWIRKGKDIPAHKIGKQWKFKCSELDEWVKSGHSAE